MSAIHQFVPMLHRHDAVGGHTLALHDLLVTSGIESRIYVDRDDPATAGSTRHFSTYEDEARPGDVLVYQLATYSVMARWLIERPEPLVVNYHSITPPSFFEAWNNGIARLQVDGLYDLAALAERADLGIAVSRFDEGELRAAGCTNTTVVPVANAPIPRSGPAGDPDPRVPRRAGASWLSVGRLAPNKGHHRTIAALFVTRATIDPLARLTVVGAPSEPHYAAALRRFAASLGLAEAVEFAVGIDSADLAARYRAADVLVMLSEHEGFGVPLVEAMGHGLPVVALAEGAVPEVAGDAGVLLERSGPRVVAEAIGRLLSDRDAYRLQSERGRRRVAAMELGDAGRRWLDAVSPLLARSADADRLGVPDGTGEETLRPPGVVTN